ncbi:hypothetical protein Cgig2_022786 [Carnegiea gigantea]|uniref:BZIP domain-containing protein n=1 Tax=Carnegiea gigantea TaxID=171969 RepID=A0A9Q1KCE6_9CARY|nr:hypothetical protein Cgig2_022786 [Carnegiea gigantea]
MSLRINQVYIVLEFPYNLDLMQNNMYESMGMVNGVLIPSPQTSSPISNSTSEDSEEAQHVSIIDERRQRRMISNRESARRSRMRKQRHIDELWSQVIRLRNENHSLLDKLSHVCESHDRALQENARLKEEAADLLDMVSFMHLASPYDALIDLEEMPCTTAHLTSDEPSNQSVAN